LTRAVRLVDPPCKVVGDTEHEPQDDIRRQAASVGVVVTRAFPQIGLDFLEPPSARLRRRTPRI
jgi:hypothetical protein